MTFQLDFSKTCRVIQVLIASPKGSVIKNVEGLAGRRAGTTRGSTNDQEATAQIKNAEIVQQPPGKPIR
jgi:polar amino acid transport system substrate-binding protein